MTLTQALDVLKNNKIGKGCKFKTVSNFIYIDYPIHKTISVDNSKSQYEKEKEVIKSLFPTFGIQTCKQNNKGGINIYLS